MLSLLLWACAQPPPPPAPVDPQAPLSEAERRGQVVYRRGAPGASAVLIGGVEVASTSLPCVGCHGRDGQGTREGGVAPPDIRQSRLSRPAEDGHAPYDDAALIRAVSMGIDSTGAELDPIMPRYRLSHQDAGDLIAYLRRLGAEPEPGVSRGHIRIGTLLPMEGEHAAIGQAIAGVLRAYFAELSGGRIYGRSIELVIAPDPADRSQRAEALAALADEQPLFALLAPLMTGDEGDIGPLSASHGLPMIGPFVDQPPAAAALDPYAFYLLGGATEQTRALVASMNATGTVGAETVVVAWAGQDGLEAALRADTQSWRRPLDIVVVADLPAVQAAVAAHSDRQRVVAALPADLAGGLLQAATEAGWSPSVYLPGVWSGGLSPAVLQGFPGTLILGLPQHASDRAHTAVQAWRLLAEARGLDTRFADHQLHALAAARLLVEGLRGAGRDLTVPGFLSAMEQIQGLETGLLPPMSFGPGRRVGAAGAFSVEVDVKTGQTRPLGWTALRL